MALSPAAKLESSGFEIAEAEFGWLLKEHGTR
jgi:hypothetical protein